MATTWTPSSWRSKPILQVPTYGDAALLASTEQKLSSLPPLVTAGEVRKLKSALAKAVTGEAFLLQGETALKHLQNSTPTTFAIRSS